MRSALVPLVFNWALGLATVGVVLILRRIAWVNFVTGGVTLDILMMN